MQPDREEIHCIRKENVDMNMDEILTLVQAVSDSKLTSFKLDQGDIIFPLRKRKKKQRSSPLAHLAL